MKKILYIGNNLRSHNSNLSGIQVLGGLLEQEGYELYYASSYSNKIMRMLDMIWSCLVLFKKVDIVLIDTYSTQNFIYARIIAKICRLLRLPYVPILHGGNLPSRLKSNPNQSKHLFGNAYYNIAPSHYIQQIFEDFGFKNMVCIPNTLEIENYPLVNKSFETPHLLWVRSFSSIYNPSLAVKVFKLVKENYPNATLCMVGPDSDGSLNEVKELAQTLNVDVKFTGKLSKQQWVELSKDYNIFINTTTIDNMPLSVIEAMSLGLPVVSTNVGGIPYLITDKKDGFLVESNNANEMAKAIVKVLNEELNRQIIIRNAREKVLEFDWKEIKKLWFKVLAMDNC
ncbi:glycosyltransferase family 4 protein [Psychroserpens sp. MEBiC05023]